MCSWLLETELKTETQVNLHSLIIFSQKVLGHSWTYRSSHQDDDDDVVPTFKALWHSLESQTSKTQKTMDLHKLSTVERHQQHAEALKLFSIVLSYILHLRPKKNGLGAAFEFSELCKALGREVLGRQPPHVLQTRK